MKKNVNDEEAILGLESIRLNPNLVSENKLRNDLEFYIYLFYSMFILIV